MGSAWSMYRELFPPAPTYSVDDIPDLKGKVIIVTGGNSGVGKEITKALLNHEATVYIASRDKAKADKVIEELKALTKHEARFLQVDLSDLKSVKQAAETFTAQEKELHVLINNAGVMMPPIEQLTKDGYDLQFGTNVLGPWYFTKKLLPLLVSTAQSSPENHTRIVNVASTGALMKGTLRFDTFKDGPARVRLGQNGLYLQSKFGNVIVAQELARRYGEQNVVSTSLNPGSLETDLYRHITNPVMKLIQKIITKPVPFGALTPLYAATHPDGKNFNGQFFIPWARRGQLGPDALNPQLGKELWTWLEEQVAPLETESSN